MNDYPFLREVRSPLSEEDLRPLDPRCNVVQFRSPLTDDDFQKLSRFLAQYPTVPLRIYGHYADGIEDLRFLRYFPTLRGFYSDVFETKSWDGLEFLPDNLEFLGLGATRKSLSLAALARFKEVRDLGLEGHKKDLEAIIPLVNIEFLSLKSISLPNLSLLEPLRKLRGLALRLGGTKELKFPDLPDLRYLELWMIRGLTDISGISDLDNLRYLFLQDLKNVTALPSLRAMPKLERLHLENLKGLTDLSPVSEAIGLRDLLLISMNHLKLDNLRCLLNHPSLRAATIGLGSLRRNKDASELLGLDSVSGDFKPIEKYTAKN